MQQEDGKRAVVMSVYRICYPASEIDRFTCRRPQDKEKAFIDVWLNFDILLHNGGEPNSGDTLTTGFFMAQIFKQLRADAQADEDTRTPSASELRHRSPSKLTEGEASADGAARAVTEAKWDTEIDGDAEVRVLDDSPNDSFYISAFVNVKRCSGPAANPRG